MSKSTPILLLIAVLLVFSTLRPHPVQRMLSDKLDGSSGVQLDMRTGDDMSLVIVAEGRSGGDISGMPGCAALSAMYLSEEEESFRGTPLQGFSRPAANSDFTRVIASPHQAGANNYYELSRKSSSSSVWASRRLRGPDGGVETGRKEALYVAPDGLALYTGHGEADSLVERGIAEIMLTDVFTDEFGYATLPSPTRFLHIGRTRASRVLEGVSEREVHVVTDDSRVLTFDPAVMGWTADEILISRIAEPPPDPTPTTVTDSTLPVVAGPPDQRRVSLERFEVDEPPTPSEFIYATITTDHRFVITNRWDIPELNFADTLERTASTIPIDASVTINAGVAINHGWINPGLLAVHGSDRILIYRFDPSRMALTKLSEISIDPPLTSRADHSPTGGQVAWDASGSRVIASTSTDSAEFVVLRVENCGTSLSIDHLMTVCPATGNYGLDILTPNGSLDAPEGYVSACPTPELRAIPTATATTRGEMFAIALPWMHR